ncbi:MAG: response regulator transcription factor [Bacteroidales bacterium]|nr:response regulator transcription factor [Bacteroidales bacterium]
MKSKTKIVVIDDEIKENHPIIIKLRQHFETVVPYSIAAKAISDIKQHLGEKTILILDLKLSGGETGYTALKDLRELSYQIPVIIWTALDERNTESFQLINLKSYAIRDKVSSLDEIVRIVQQADADIEYGLSNALEKWILAQPGNRDEPFVISTGGKIISLNDMLDEVRRDSPRGRSFTQDLVNLTIELMKKDTNE